ncbi:GrpB family protein [Nocardioides sp. W7]|uniref:GrpB family protein n=1 Tax=Nocardioides sp. W7 TaxID=2931390 RepID=UPI001FD62251|nr:GrpB family protein [Nocardioides sp. W7]
MDTHPLWRPYDVPSEEQVAAARVRTHVPERVEVVPPDPAWPAAYDEVRRLVGRALGERVLAIEHVGSTSVPGLHAKPFIDVDLTVADTEREADYLPALEAAGFVLRVREPEWQHRVFRMTRPLTTLHVWSPGAQEPQRHVAFRDWLASHADDRATYADLKCRLGERGFTDSMVYNNEKAGLIYDIYERIFVADPEHPHTPQPRS